MRPFTPMIAFVNDRGRTNMACKLNDEWYATVTLKEVKAEKFGITESQIKWRIDYAEF